MSGAPLTHFAQTHPVNERDILHESANSGAGYYDARQREEGVHFRQLSEEPASTRRSGVTICDAQPSTASYYVRSCGITFQDFVRPRNSPSDGRHIAYAIVESPSFLYWHKVEGYFLKAYTSRLTPGGTRVWSIIGRPVGEEGTCLLGARCQVFEHGSIWRSTTVSGGERQMSVINESGNVIMLRGFTEYIITGECLSFDANATVNSADLGLVASHFGSNGTENYDQLYDAIGGNEGIPLGLALGDGVIGAADLGAVSAFFGMCPPEL